MIVPKASATTENRWCISDKSACPQTASKENHQHLLLIRKISVPLQPDFGFFEIKYLILKVLALEANFRTDFNYHFLLTFKLKKQWTV
jgi:hypothetical protein